MASSLPFKPDVHLESPAAFSACADPGSLLIYHLSAHAGAGPDLGKQWQRRRRSHQRRGNRWDRAPNRVSTLSTPGETLSIHTPGLPGFSHQPDVSHLLNGGLLACV